MQKSAPQLSLFAEESFPAPLRPGETPGVSVRESRRARRLSIKVYPGGRVEVVVPRRTRPAEVARFVTENRDWIRRAREELMGDHGDGPGALPTRISLPAIGREFGVRYEARPGARNVRWRAGAERIVLHGRTGDTAHCVAALKRWLASIAKAEFAPRLDALAAQTGIAYRRLQVRAQRSCWGSRSCSGTVSLNLCLLFLRPELLRYLMLHELCHGRHMNHSKRYWRLVASFEPDCRQLDRELGDSWRAVPAWLGIY